MLPSMCVYRVHCPQLNYQPNYLCGSVGGLSHDPTLYRCKYTGRVNMTFCLDNWSPLPLFSNPVQVGVKAMLLKVGWYMYVLSQCNILATATALQPWVTCILYLELKWFHSLHIQPLTLNGDGNLLCTAVNLPYCRVRIHIPRFLVS